MQPLSDVGARFAARLAARTWKEPPLVVAIRPAAVPIAFEVARPLRAELDLLEVRTFDAPGSDRELGAVASGGMRVLHAHVLEELGITDEQAAEAATRAQAEILRDERAWRRRHPRASFGGASVVLVGDALAGDGRMLAAVMVARACGAAEVVVVAPCATRGAIARVREEADEVVCLDEVDEVGQMRVPTEPSPATIEALLERAEEWRAPMVVGG